MFASVFRALLDAIAPPKGRTERLRTIGLEHVPLEVASHDLLGVTIVTLMAYKDQAVQDLVQSLKYDGGGRSARLLASLVAEYLLEEIADTAVFSKRPIILHPVPLHASRRRERGFNQIESVLERLPANLRDGPGARLARDMLIRTRATEPQTRLARSDRLSNVAGAFALKEDTDLRGRHIYLFDDVATTGATLANAAAPLRRAGARVSLIALARA